MSSPFSWFQKEKEEVEDRKDPLPQSFIEERKMNKFVIAMDDKVSHLRLKPWLLAFGKLKQTKLVFVFEGAERYGARVIGDKLRDFPNKTDEEIRALWTVGQIQMMNIAKLRLAETKRRAGQLIVDDMVEIEPTIRAMFKRGIVPLCCTNLGYSSQYLAAKIAKEISSDALIYLTESDGVKDSDGNLLRSMNLEEQEISPTTHSPHFERLMGAEHYGGPTIIASGFNDLPEDVIMMNTGTVINSM